MCERDAGFANSPVMVLMVECDLPVREAVTYAETVGKVYEARIEGLEGWGTRVATMLAGLELGECSCTGEEVCVPCWSAVLVTWWRRVGIKENAGVAGVAM